MHISLRIELATCGPPRRRQFIKTNFNKQNKKIKKNVDPLAKDLKYIFIFKNVLPNKTNSNTCLFRVRESFSAFISSCVRRIFFASGACRLLAIFLPTPLTNCKKVCSVIPLCAFIYSTLPNSLGFYPIRIVF